MIRGGQKEQVMGPDAAQSRKLGKFCHSAAWVLKAAHGLTYMMNLNESQNFYREKVLGNNSMEASLKHTRFSRTFSLSVLNTRGLSPSTAHDAP